MTGSKGTKHVTPPPSIGKTNSETNIFDDVTSMTSVSDIIDVHRDEEVVKSLYKLSEDLIKFLNKSEGSDVKIEIGKEPEAETFYAHSAILRARSSYFDVALTKKSVNPNKTDD